MKYQILMVTFTTPVPVGSSGVDELRPFFNRTSISFATAQIGKLTVEDDDDQFGMVTSTEGYPSSTQQKLVSDTAIGNDGTIARAGIQLSNYLGSVIRDAAGNEFRVIFPLQGSPNQAAPSLLGDGSSVLIFPVPKVVAGVVTLPVFDPTASFKFSAKYSVTSTNSATPYWPSAAACFTRGTRIETLWGPRLVEELRAGDLILTRDNGLQPLRWIGGATLCGLRLDLQPHLRPIRIRAGALGDGTPARDLSVSPQHRVLLRSEIAARMFAADEVLLAAKHLLGVPGIEVARARDGVSYFHLLFERHELVLSEGCWTESLHLGAEALASLGPAALREIRAIFPDLIRPDPALRPLLGGREGRELVSRHLRQRRRFVAPAA
ncbi:Hint domain-containing protein [Paracoccus aminophilus]|uniref:Hedgehog/Intein (Hint) domain-containing protein n=1 Tax=Paracoccus aminophilus JCM 7686 TaxID=1367847 RepID=S5Y8Q3_PARAH|nr:Hint domain-containing protein [Paracoccus aminophilus]AGT07723.1 hypothetical protein JCM7686_0614 [Paracoccus aminophilus JCM 7686]